MSPHVLDYSYARPGPAQIAADGYLGVIRYLCHPGDSKRLTASERDRLHAAGLAVGLVWETTAARPLAGYGAGAADAVAANRYADDLDWPPDRPIFYAVDTDTGPDQVRAYFAAVANTGGRPWGLYGSYRVVEGFAGITPWLWQCAAWSGTGRGTGGSIEGRRLSRHAVLFQRVAQVYAGAADVNDVLAADWGGWHPTHHPGGLMPADAQAILDKITELRDAIGGLAAAGDADHDQAAAWEHDTRRLVPTQALLIPGDPRQWVLAITDNGLGRWWIRDGDQRQLMVAANILRGTDPIALTGDLADALTAVPEIAPPGRG